MKILILLIILAVGFVSSQVKIMQKPTNAKVSVSSSKSLTAQVKKVQKATNATQYSVNVPKSKLLAASNAVSSKEDVEEDFKNQLSAYSSWEDSLSLAPISIGLLGDLMILSSCNQYTDPKTGIVGGKYSGILRLGCRWPVSEYAVSLIEEVSAPKNKKIRLEVNSDSDFED